MECRHFPQRDAKSFGLFSKRGGDIHRVARLAVPDEHGFEGLRMRARDSAGMREDGLVDGKKTGVVGLPADLE